MKNLSLWKRKQIAKGSELISSEAGITDLPLANVFAINPSTYVQ